MIDDDLGQSGTSTHARDDFQRLAEDVAHGRVGAIFSLEVSRLTRSSADWHHLLDLCGLADVVLIDEQAVYTPRDYDDRLLLGLKGTMSEAEGERWMRSSPGPRMFPREVHPLCDPPEVSRQGGTGGTRQPIETKTSRFWARTSATQGLSSKSGAPACSARAARVEKVSSSQPAMNA